MFTNPKKILLGLMVVFALGYIYFNWQRSQIHQPIEVQTGFVKPQAGSWEGIIWDFISRSPVTIQGAKVDLKGSSAKLVLVNFWSISCPPCVAEIPYLQQLQKRYPKDLLLIGLSFDPLGKLSSFAQRKGVNYALVNQLPENTALQTQLLSIPTTIIFDHEGRQIALVEQMLDEELMNPLLNTFQIKE